MEMVHVNGRCAAVESDRTALVHIGELGAAARDMSHEETVDTREKQIGGFRGLA
jgi:hypothetical protein